MQFVKKGSVRGCLVGYLKDSEGRNIEVRHSPEDGYYCEFKNKLLKAPNIEELNNLVVKTMGWKREWINVIIVTGNRKQYSGCPSTLHIDLGYEAVHIAQLSDGSWVMANWSPNVEIKYERKSEELPNEFTMPCKIGNKWCNSESEFKIMLPYSEVTMLKLRAYQLMVKDKINALTLGLLDSAIGIPEVSEILSEPVASDPEDDDGDE